MGEILIARDPNIGRDVAIKRMAATAPSDDEVARFLREARIQARLEHPAIVPVHEVGHDANGRPYFTMKRLAGTTLQQRLGHARLQELLRAFVDVCLAIDFAHSRRVVHRDLKPANIMLGDYGEVYVLDWGVARVLTGRPDPDRRRPHAQSLDSGVATRLRFAPGISVTCCRRKRTMRRQRRLTARVLCGRHRGSRLLRSRA